MALGYPSSTRVPILGAAFFSFLRNTQKDSTPQVGLLMRLESTVQTHQAVSNPTTQDKLANNKGKWNG